MIYGGFGNDQPLFVVMDGGICRAPEPENSADCVVQVKLMITERYLTRLSLHDDHPKPVEIFCHKCKGQLEK